jgi:hypothetical protein
MPMPKGFKSKGGYATIDPTWGGMNFRNIAEHMTDEGDKMNHSTARNIFLRAMSTIASHIAKNVDGDVASPDIQEIARNPEFQAGVAEILRELQ